MSVEKFNLKYNLCSNRKGIVCCVRFSGSCIPVSINDRTAEGTVMKYRRFRYGISPKMNFTETGSVVPRNSQAFFKS